MVSSGEHEFHIELHYLKCDSNSIDPGYDLSFLTFSQFDACDPQCGKDGNLIPYYIYNLRNW